MPPDPTTARELLDFYLEAGADALVGEEPVDRFAEIAPAPRAAVAPAAAKPAAGASVGAATTGRCAAAGCGGHGGA